jgi:nucleoside-diphosphate-sugar epimerase
VILPDSEVGICNAVYVDDVVSAMIFAATNREAVGERFLISGPSPISWAQFYEEVAAAVGAKGPQYMTAQAIARRAGTVRTILRFATDPIRVMRRVSRTALGAKVIAACLRPLPRGMRGHMQRLLELPYARRPGYVHMPDVRSHFKVNCAKARRVIGYEPQFDFAAGMVPTATYLRQYARRGD